MKKLFLSLFFLIIVVTAVALYFLFRTKSNSLTSTISLSSPGSQASPAASTQTPTNPLSISSMRQQSYPGSDITIEQTLPDGSNYHQYLTSYQSNGLKIYALLTVPEGDKPTTGWPVILFNHGYIDPAQYKTYPTVGQYASYYPVFSRAGYIVFKPDYRGNGNSDGQPEGAYYSPGYAIDDLNALASIKKYTAADPNRIGIWAHSMGGNITLRDLVINTSDVKAAVIWGGVVGSYDDLMNNWEHKVPFQPSPRELALRNNDRASLIQQYGTPQTDPSFWNSIDPTFFVQDITTPIQLDVGANDEEVPVAFSQSLYDKLKADNKTVEFYSYLNGNHNITQGFDLAMQRSLAFFDKYLK